MAKAFNRDFQPELGTFDLDADRFDFTDDVRVYRQGSANYFRGSEGSDIIVGGSRPSDIHGGEGSDWLMIGKGGGSLSGGNDGFDGDIMFGREGVATTIHMGPADYASGVGGEHLYVIHKAGPSGYVDHQGRVHEAFIKRFDPDLSKIDVSGEAEIESVVRGPMTRHNDGSVERQLLGVHMSGENNERFFVRIEPEIEVSYTSQDGSPDGAREALGALVEEWFV